MEHFVDSYGSFPFLEKYFSGKFQIEFTKESNFYIYKRNLLPESERKFTLPVLNYTNLLIQPTEPLISDFSTTYLLLLFNNPLVLFPDSEIQCFCDFPISLSFFLQNDRRLVTHIDMLNLSKTKLALYGDSHKGIVCRLWKTEISTEPVSQTLFETGCLELSVVNTSSVRAILTKSVFDFSFIQIFFKGNECKAKARIRVISDQFAETEFLTPSDISETTQSIDLIPTKILSKSKFLMEFGL
ncbi:MAG: DUF432 domain-containing protein [Ignavibacteria bacterium]|nr:DUF432 domain-containing protein [Ignavibacteria bacterium]